MTITKPIKSLRDAVMIDVEEVAAMLSCSSRTVYRLADGGRMPQPIRLGGMVRWNREAILEWISAGCPRCDRGAKRG